MPSWNRFRVFGHYIISNVRNFGNNFAFLLFFSLLSWTVIVGEEKSRELQKKIDESDEIIAGRRHYTVSVLLYRYSTGSSVRQKSERGRFNPARIKNTLAKHRCVFWPSCSSTFSLRDAYLYAKRSIFHSPPPPSRDFRLENIFYEERNSKIC